VEPRLLTSSEPGPWNPCDWAHLWNSWSFLWSQPVFWPESGRRNAGFSICQNRVIIKLLIVIIIVCVSELSKLESCKVAPLFLLHPTFHLVSVHQCCNGKCLGGCAPVSPPSSPEITRRACSWDSTIPKEDPIFCLLWESHLEIKNDAQEHHGKSSRHNVIFWRSSRNYFITGKSSIELENPLRTGNYWTIIQKMDINWYQPINKCFLMFFPLPQFPKSGRQPARL
jgi:hypothetical protein